MAKAEQLVHEFADLGPLAASGFDWIDAPVDLIINGTSASLAGELPPIAPGLIAPGHTVCYDMMYGKEPTAFNRWASDHGAARTLDGLGMLVEQAAEAFYLWRDVRPDAAPVLQHLPRAAQCMTCRERADSAVNPGAAALLSGASRFLLNLPSFSCTQPVTDLAPVPVH